MKSNESKKKISENHEVEDKIFRAGAALYCSCMAYDVVSNATIGESMNASEEFAQFIHCLLAAGAGKNFIARERALKRLIYHK